MKLKSILFLIVTIFVSQALLAQNYQFDWAKSFLGSNGSGTAIAVDHENSLYSAGIYKGLTDFDPDTGVFYLSPLNENMGYLSKLSAQGEFIWAVSIDFTDLFSIHTISVDCDGSVYLAGGFRGSCDFDPGPDTCSHTSFGTYDAYVMKVDSLGDFQWVKTFRATLSAVITAMEVDQNKNVYVSGTFKDSVDFDPDSSIVYYLYSGTYYDLFVCCLDSVGNLSWLKSLDSSENCQAHGFRVNDMALEKDYLILTGCFEMNTDFDPGPGTSNMGALRKTTYVVKFDLHGDFVWSKSFVTYEFYNEGIGVAIDNDDNVYVTGNYSGQVDFDTGPGITFLPVFGPGTTYSDLYVAKLDSMGNTLWERAFGAYLNDYVNGIDVDENGNSFICGGFLDTIDINPDTLSQTIYYVNGFSDIFILGLNTSGDYLYSAQIGGAHTEFASDILFDNAGNVCTTGDYYSDVDFDPGTGVFDLNSTGLADAFVLKLSPATVGISVAENIGIGDVLIYPNPTEQYLRLETGQTLTNGCVEAYNINGKKVMSVPLGNQKNARVDLGYFPSSIYFINVIDNGRVILSEKIIKL
ncbi:MAG: T9SS type A sorting domain-containing protein [Bacteroidales bacterium]|nr:T9SS type A sorting domain-containing protein [Bacteroidales bacterium]MCF8456061.1 T9SS type A sorting domain-containing protein [Bacteroidales bacterium]